VLLTLEEIVSTLQEEVDLAEQIGSFQVFVDISLAKEALEELHRLQDLEK
jgi:hypothetical protein